MPLGVDVERDRSVGEITSGRQIQRASLDRIRHVAHHHVPSMIQWVIAIRHAFHQSECGKRVLPFTPFDPASVGLSVYKPAGQVLTYVWVLFARRARWEGEPILS